MAETPKSLRSWKRLRDFLFEVTSSVKSLVKNGYYESEKSVSKKRRILKEEARKHALPIIAELKAKSPGYGELRSTDFRLANKLVQAGACAISVLVEPVYFGGSLSLLREVAQNVDAPILFKDFVISKKQLVTADRCGADIVLLIAEVFERGLSCDSLEEMIESAHALNLEVLLETHDPKNVALVNSTKAEYIGINNRNLVDLSLDPDHFFKLSKQYKKQKFTVAESGYSDALKIKRDFEAGADCFLIGGSIMSAKDPIAKLKELIAHEG